MIYILSKYYVLKYGVRGLVKKTFRSTRSEKLVSGLLKER